MFVLIDGVKRDSSLSISVVSMRYEISRPLSFMTMSTVQSDCHILNICCVIKRLLIKREQFNFGTFKEEGFSNLLLVKTSF